MQTNTGMLQYSPEPNTGCWLWLGPLDAEGYAWDEGAHLPAHVAFWHLAFGRPTAQQHVVQICGTRSCVNPAHLRLQSAPPAKLLAGVG
jgi:hypothetical protein